MAARALALTLLCTPTPHCACMQAARRRSAHSRDQPVQVPQRPQLHHHTQEAGVDEGLVEAAPAGEQEEWWAGTRGLRAARLAIERAGAPAVEGIPGKRCLGSPAEANSTERGSARGQTDTAARPSGGSSPYDVPVRQAGQQARFVQHVAPPAGRQQAQVGLPAARRGGRRERDAQAARLAPGWVGRLPVGLRGRLVGWRAGCCTHLRAYRRPSARRSTSKACGAAAVEASAQGPLGLPHFWALFAKHHRLRLGDSWRTGAPSSHHLAQISPTPMPPLPTSAAPPFPSRRTMRNLACSSLGERSPESKKASSIAAHRPGILND